MISQSLATADRLIAVGWWTWAGICLLAVVAVLVHQLREPRRRRGSRGRYRVSRLDRAVRINEWREQRWTHVPTN